MKISIGIPFYNPGNYFKDAIHSVLMQTYRDFELILLDDGSSDNSLTIAKSFDDERIRIISDGKNKGLPARLNQLITLSEGEYILRMDADDLIASRKVAQQVAYLDEHPNINIVSTGICSLTNDYKVMGYREPTQKNNVKLTPSETIFGRSDIAHATIMARKSWYLRNKYNEQAKLMEDYQLWIEASIKEDLSVGYISDPLYFYREESSVSSQKAIIAYKNQFSLVFKQYFNHLSFYEKLKFTLLSSIKISLVFLLNLFSNISFLLAIRNKNTSQKAFKIQALQDELDTLRIK